MEQTKSGISKDYCILQVLSGEGTISLDGKYYFLNDNVYCFIDPGVLYTFTRNNEEFRYYVKNFTKEDIDEELKYIFSEKTFVINTDDPDLAYYLSRTCVEYKYQFENYYYLNKAIERLFKQISNKIYYFKEDLELVSYIAKLKKELLKNDLSVLSNPHLNKKLYNKYHLTLKQFITNEKCIYCNSKKIDGLSVMESCRLYNVSKATFYRHNIKSSNQKKN